MFWAGISYSGKTELVKVNDTMNGRKYRDDILTNHVVPHRDALPQAQQGDFVLVDDNCRPHRAGLVNDFLRQHGVSRMNPWPAKSPDLNAIENAWSWLKLRILRRLQPRDGLVELERYAVEEWALLPQRILQRLVSSMHRRCEAVYAVQGSHTKY